MFQLPLPPTFTDEQFSKARSEKYFYPIVFELYKHVAIMGITCAQIRGDSPDFRQIPARHYAILVGLLNRICRLMLSTIALTHEGLYGETMRLLNRCIVESVINILWLCQQNDPSLFQRYLADGTKSEIELLDVILSNISQRDGQALAIEVRMLSSIRRVIESTGLSPEEIRVAPKLPNFKNKLSALHFNDQAYLVMQKIGSHAIHGTWPDLLGFYLEWDKDNNFLPADHDSRPHAYDYIHVSSFVLDAMRCFLNYITESKYDLDRWTPQIKLTADLLTKVEALRSEGDFESPQDDS